MAKSRKGAAAKKAPAAPDGAEGGDDALSFEGALEQLETTVGRLEEGEMPLEEALELFEKGVALSRRCSQTLEAAEKRIEVLVADESDGQDDDWASAPFDEIDEDEEADELDD